MDESLSLDRLSLPKPDMENITVLTKNLPNEPILPWHRFDSPWLERQDDDQTEAESPEALAVEDAATNDEAVEQLTLEIVEPEATPEDLSPEAAE